MARSAARIATSPRLPAGAFPDLELPLGIPYPPMEATTADTIPAGAGWQFEPKWDGFRCLAFRHGDRVALQSKAGQSLDRYFPELVESLRTIAPEAFILDGEIVVPTPAGLSFDDLLLRIHPASSRIRRLAVESPARLVAFDFLYSRHFGLLTTRPLQERRNHLETLFETVSPEALLRLSPATTNRAVAERWFHDYGPFGLDGIVAKRLEESYRSGERAGMVKVKRFKTADCVVGGFRWTKGKKVGSLLVGLYDDQQRLHYVGHTSSFTDQERNTLRTILEPLKTTASFAVRVPGGPSRWSKKETTEWEPVRPELVCEVRYDYFSQNRFRHGTKFLRWRPEKPAAGCTWDQVVSPRVTDIPSAFRMVLNR